MSQADFKIVIPSRMSSTRFPGKPLHPLNGKAMLLHVIDRARESAASSIIVATDDERIQTLCNEAGVQIEMTDPSHISGTDRIAEVAERLSWTDDTIIVGLQGDEPATSAESLNTLANNLNANSDADMATFCTPVIDVQEYQNTNRVKVVRDYRGMALYFSRASIPYRRDLDSNSEFPDAFIHVGLYAYRCHYLKQFSALPPAYLEEQEQLEQLRVLYNGGRIHVDVITEVAAGVDHLEDVAAIETILKKRYGES